MYLVFHDGRWQCVVQIGNRYYNGNLLWRLFIFCIHFNRWVVPIAFVSVILSIVWEAK